jgi:hypothetical protein
MKNVSKSLGANALSSILISLKYPIGILLSGTVSDTALANDREHDTGKTEGPGVRYDEADGLVDRCCIIAAIGSQLNNEPAQIERPHGRTSGTASDHRA